MTATTPKLTQAVTPPLSAKTELKDIIKTLPKACFQKNSRKAWQSALLSVLAVALGYVAIALLPWYTLPLTWIFTGTALTGWFVIAHDCGHRSFAKRRWVNDLVGHVFMMPLIYPFHSWRLLHDFHHLHTNELEVDNAWQPWTENDYVHSNPKIRALYEQLRGRFWWLASIAHWGKLHFDPSQVAQRDRKKVRLSVTVVAVFAAIFFPTLLLTTGVWGVVKFWLVPWLVYHFWMSTFTLVHHTSPDIAFYPTESWNAAQSQLNGTVHCTYPRWVEILCHDINVHIPHHVSTAIPHYNLRMAHKNLLQNWGSEMRQSRFSWALMKQIVDYCHLYHPERVYQRFTDVK